MAAYEADDDPYCYRGTSVLKNVPGIRDRARLARFEAVVVAQRALEPLPRGKLSLRHYRSIHHHLFQDVYRWAGRFRSVRTHKGGSTFCYPEHIPSQMAALFITLRQADFFTGLSVAGFASQAAHFVATLNAIHPFREGNGRSQTVFLGLLAARAGHGMEFSRLDATAFREAMIESFSGSEKPLAAQIHSLIEP